MIRIRIFLDEKLHERAKSVAKRRGISFAELCRRGLKETIAKEPSDKPWMVYSGIVDGDETDSSTRRNRLRRRGNSMKDTKGDISERYRSMFMKLDPVQRLKIGCRMFNTSRALVDAGIRLELGDTVDEKERRRLLLIRLYGQDLSREQIEAFIRKTSCPDL